MHIKYTIMAITLLIGNIGALNGMEKRELPSPTSRPGAISALPTNAYFFSADDTYTTVSITDLDPKLHADEGEEMKAEARSILKKLKSSSDLKNPVQKERAILTEMLRQGTQQQLENQFFHSKHFETSHYMIFEIPFQIAHHLSTFGFPIYTAPSTAFQQITINIQEVQSETLEKLMRTTDPTSLTSHLFFTYLVTNNNATQTSSNLPELRATFLQLSQIATCFAKLNRTALLRLSRQKGADQKSLMTNDIVAWQSLATQFSVALPSLNNAYIIYQNLKTLSQVRFADVHIEGDAYLNGIAKDEHLIVRLMLDMLRPYANAFLLSEGRELILPLEWDRSKIPNLIKRRLQAFKEVAEERQRKYKEYIQRVPQITEQAEAEEKEKKQPKKRHRNRKRKKTNTNPTSPISAPSNSQASAQQTTTASPDSPLPPPTTQALVATIIASRAIATTPEIAQPAPSAQEEELPKQAARKKEIEELRAQTEKDKEQKRQAIVNADKLIREQKARAEIQKLKTSRLLALDTAEQEKFNTYLKQKGLTNDPMYQAILKPRSSTQNVTQDHIDTFFRKLCDHLKEFLNQQEIGSTDDRSSFVAAVLRDLLGTRHNYHNRSEAEDLPHNYITHRRGALIYAGLIPIQLMEEVGSDNRRALEMYNRRLLSRALLSNGT